MGQGESQPQEGRAQSSSTGVAFHVLRVAEQSPAAEAGIDPFFDFICGVNGRPLGDEIEELTGVLEDSEGSQVVLQVYSTKRKELRDVEVIPSRSWSANGSYGSAAGVQPSLLGLSLRLCHPQAALEQVWHVLEILEGSPAQSAGLVPFGDWIVGYAGGVLRGEGDFYDVVEAHVDKPLRLFVYNADYDVTREAILVPNRSWGGEGLLGCGVGYGLLHRIPKPQDRVLPPISNNYNASGDESESDSAGEDDDRGMLGYVSASQTSPAASGMSRQDSEGFEEASYGEGGGRFDASEGVEVVAVGDDEEEPFGFFSPADAFSKGGKQQPTPMMIPLPPAGQRSSYGYSPNPRRASVVPSNPDGIAEEE